jgi:putative peptidoglycan lipid II flippase
MVASTIVTAVSLPVYWTLYRAYGGTGLVIASNIGILLQTFVLAIMLHLRGMVSLAGLDWRELARSAAAATLAGALCALILRAVHLQQGFRFDLAVLTAGSLAWLLVAWAALKLTGSALPAELRRRLLRT